VFKTHSFTQPWKHPCIYWHHFRILNTTFIIKCGTFCNAGLKTFEVAACLCIMQGVPDSTRRFSTYQIMKSCLTARDMYSMPLRFKFSRSLTIGRDFHLWPTATNNIELRLPPRFLCSKVTSRFFVYLHKRIWRAYVITWASLAVSIAWYIWLTVISYLFNQWHIYIPCCVWNSAGNSVRQRDTCNVFGTRLVVVTVWIVAGRIKFCPVVRDFLRWAMFANIMCSEAWFWTNGCTFTNNQRLVALFHLFFG
jgi:hypothetical protein